ncbi:Temperature dependent protein affecting M2 dsRNA replication [Rhizoctonia solani]|uniref:Temperature dependent protein affecting M2 dsRNA replication n=1 Tax=Rhizoctonia solani TaxID=456999 RepID=A0A8H7M203_9AGAM|nr:Temperature dependent protein affecting M2 dsRNA replication [Rhizoctonia solani]
MVIKNLDSYISEWKHDQTLPLSTLAESRLGIDASHYLSNLLDNPTTRESYLAATGGIPLSLASRIEQDLRALEKLHIKPVFVFPGLPPNKRISKNTPQQNAAKQMEAAQARRDAWNCYESGRNDQATKLFESRSNVEQWDLWRPVLRIFRHRNVEFIIAPYSSLAQLVYLQRHPKSYVHALYGPSELLLYAGVEKVILSLDLSAQSNFTFVTKSKMMTDLQLNEDQFLDLGLLCGSEYSPTLPPNANETSIKPFAFLDNPLMKQSNYAETFARARCMVKFALVLSSEGSVVPLPIALSGGSGGTTTTAADIPSDLHDIFTNRLPDEVFYYLSRGLFTPQPLVWLTSGQVIENPPLDNGETNEYRRFVKDVITEGATGPRATALALITSVFHNSWQKTRVMTHFWYDNNPKNFISPNAAQTTSLVERVVSWNVPSTIVEDELRRQSSSTIDFALCLGATSTDKLASRTRTKPNLNHPLEKKDEVVANVIWRFLELRGFLLHSHTHSPLARALHATLSSVRVNDKFQDSMYLFLEMVRAGVIHGNLWSGRAYSGGPSFGDDEEKKSMLLIMRVLSIVPLSCHPQPWSGPLSRELLVFNSFLRSLSKALRTLVETVALNMLLQQHARRPREDLLEIAVSLPFQQEVNTGYGILAKVYLDALVAMNGGPVKSRDDEGVQEAKDGAMELVEETFTGVKYPRYEVERGFRFWDAALSAIRNLSQDESGSVVSAELVESFEKAQAWLAPMRP